MGYEGYFSPLIFGLVSFLPSIVLYPHRELPLRRTLIRKALHFILLEGMLITFGHWAGVLQGFDDTASFALTVLIVYLLVNFLSWQMDSKQAAEINKTLKVLQGRNAQ